jgi:hypothetical protein
MAAGEVEWNEIAIAGGGVRLLWERLQKLFLSGNVRLL